MRDAQSRYNLGGDEEGGDDQTGEEREKVGRRLGWKHIRGIGVGGQEEEREKRSRIKVKKNLIEHDRRKRI